MAEINLTKTFTRPSEALEYFKNNPIDILFLDIQMPVMSGLEISLLLPKNIIIIFTTAYTDYAVEGFNLDAADYLLKPFTYERFQKAVTKAQVQFEVLRNNEVKPDYIIISCDSSTINISLSAIVLIEALDDYIKIHLLDQAPLIARMTMKSIGEQLPNRDFIRVHRSFIVPLKSIESVRNKNILINTREIPIGPRYEETFFNVFGSK